jgi:hypothetical protein
VTEERRRQKDELASFEAEEANRKFKEDFPFCDEHSAAIADAISHTIERHGNPFDDSAEMRKASHSNADPRVLRIFCSGYDVGKDGQPLTDLDAEKKARDMDFIRDYISGDANLRRPHLERIKAEMLNISLTPEMLTPEYMNVYAAELKEMCDKMVYFVNVTTDDAAYFESLPQREQDLIGALLKEWPLIVTYLNTALCARAVKLDYGILYGAKDGAVVEYGREYQEMFREKGLNAITACGEIKKKYQS